MNIAKNSPLTNKFNKTFAHMTLDPLALNKGTSFMVAPVNISNNSTHADLVARN